jgi:cytidine deaminase
LIRYLLATGLFLAAILVALAPFGPQATTKWHLTSDSLALVPQADLQQQIFRALDAAEHAGTDPSISHFRVRAATTVTVDGVEHVVLGGNTEYEVPEALHGETSLLNHVTTLYGADVTRHAVRFVAFFSKRSGLSGSCGDCRDYQRAVTDYSHLLTVCGQASDHSVRVTRFSEQLVDEGKFPSALPDSLPISPGELARLTQSAMEARLGGITLFTATQHTGAAGLSFLARYTALPVQMMPPSTIAFRLADFSSKLPRNVTIFCARLLSSENTANGRWSTIETASMGSSPAVSTSGQANRPLRSS